MSTIITAKDLSKEAPTSPRTRIGGYVILGRAADKGRATLADTKGEFHFACSLDMMLFDFKGVSADDVKQLLADGKSDEEIAAWLDANGTPKTVEEIKAWGDAIEAARPYDNPEKKEWFEGACAEAKCDPATSTLFDYLDADDKTTFAAA